MPRLASRIHTYCACSIVYVGQLTRDAPVCRRQAEARLCTLKRRRAVRRHLEGGILDVALLGCAGMPLGVGIVRAAEPLAAALAILLSAFVAGFIHARNSLAGLFLGLDGCCRHRSSAANACRQEGGCQWAGSTTPTLFTPLQAIYTRPSTVAAILRTVPPPEGILVRAMVSVLGSNRTIVFGFTPASLYQ